MVIAEWNAYKSVFMKFSDCPYWRASETFVEVSSFLQVGNAFAYLHNGIHVTVERSGLTEWKWLWAEKNPFALNRNKSILSLGIPSCLASTRHTENLDCQPSLAPKGVMSVKKINAVGWYTHLLRCQWADYFNLVSQHLHLHGKKKALEN